MAQHYRAGLPTSRDQRRWSNVLCALFCLCPGRKSHHVFCSTLFSPSIISPLSVPPGFPEKDYTRSRVPGGIDRRQSDTPLVCSLRDCEAPGECFARTEAAADLKIELTLQARWGQSDPVRETCCTVCVSVQERCTVKEVYTVVLSLGWPACRSLGPGRRILLILSPGNISNILKIFFRSESLRTIQILVISRADPSRDFPSFLPSLSVIKNNFDQSRLTLCGPEQQSKQLTYGHYSSDEGDWTGKESVLDSFLKVTTLISYDATADIFYIELLYSCDQ